MQQRNSEALPNGASYLLTGTTPHNSNIENRHTKKGRLFMTFTPVSLCLHKRRDRRLASSVNALLRRFPPLRQNESRELIKGTAYHARCGERGNSIVEIVAICIVIATVAAFALPSIANS